MDPSASPASLSGPQHTPLRAFTAAELNKLNKAELNRERNKLLAQIEKFACEWCLVLTAYHLTASIDDLLLAESSLEDEQEQHAVTKEDMNEFIVNIYYRDQERSRSKARATVTSTPTLAPASTSRTAASPLPLIERPEVVKIRILKRVLGISDSEHKRILVCLARSVRSIDSHHDPIARHALSLP